MGPRCRAVLLDTDVGHGLAAGPARTSGKPGSGPSQWSKDTHKAGGNAHKTMGSTRQGAGSNTGWRISLTYHTPR